MILYTVKAFVKHSVKLETLPEHIKRNISYWV